MDFTDKNVVITGGSAGIGFATAKAFINAGANVLVTGRNAANLEKAAKEINSRKFHILTSDISKLADISVLEKTIAEYGKKLDVLFLNAGIVSAAPIEQTSEKQFDDLFNVNVKGLYFTLQKLIPHLADGSSVVITSSGVSVGAYLTLSAYSATKAAVDTIARVAANELAERNIRVNIVAPGITDTPMNFGGKTAEEVDAIKKFYEDRIPLNRVGNPEEVANTVLFLASDKASYITGACLNVDGGILLRKF